MIYSGTHSLTLREDKGTRLTVSEVDGNFKYLNNLASSSASQESYRNLTYSDFVANSFTVSTTDTYLFVECPIAQYLNIYLPDPADMPGKKLSFVKTDNNYENEVTLHGTFNSETFYSLYGWGSTATFVSNGNSWWLVYNWG